MKKLLSVLLVVTLFISSSSFKTNTKVEKLSNDKTKVEVIFNHQLDFNDIVKIKLDLSQKGIVINYKMLAFDENGKLKSINFFVDCNDGFSGSASESSLTNKSRIGFYRDYSKDASSPFGTGRF
jgi:uncharacterized protein YxeA